MFKIILLLAIVSMCVANEEAGHEDLKKEEGEREKRLIFFDENGDLVKTYSLNKKPYTFINYLDIPNNFALLPTQDFSIGASASNKPIQYMIPISDQMTQDIAHDPIYQNKLILLPSRQTMVNVARNTLCNGKREQIPSPMSCSNFLNCWDGWAFEQECPQGLLFSSQGYCDYPHNVNCNERYLAIGDASTQPKCEKEFQAYRHQFKCNEFYVCVNKSPISFKCPDGLMYNQDIGVCDYSSRVNCNMGSEENTDRLKPLADEPAAPSKPEIPAVEPPPSIKMFFNSQGWSSSSHVATSRLDALRQMELKKLAKVESQ